MSGLVVRCRDFLRRPGDVLEFASTGKQMLYVKKYHPPPTPTTNNTKNTPEEQSQKVSVEERKT